MGPATPPHQPGRADPAAVGRRYERIAEAITSERCVVLDGAVGTQLIDVVGSRPEADERLWGVSELITAQDAVKGVHAAYVAAGADVITTDTWGLPTALHADAASAFGVARPVHWMDVARRGVSVAREAAGEGGRGDEVAVAFGLNGDIDGELETVRLLLRALEEDPPDLLLLETLSLVRSSTYDTISALMSTGIPLWLSFRRCRHGVCGVYGEHWGGPEGDTFGRAARRFKELGVGALLINCIPPDHVPGMVSWLRDFTDLPLGVYPNLGYLSAGGWSHEHDIDGAQYADLALQWRAEGAQIIGGCCGVNAGHIAAAARALAGTKPGTTRPPVSSVDELGAPAEAPPPSWTDRRGTVVFPVPLPDVIVHPGVAEPDQVSLMLWKFLTSEGTGSHQRCLDVGTGSGMQAVQLGLNGAAHVYAIDRDERAIRNTMSNAFRNGVADRLTAATVDLYPWVPEERYDIVVANIDQTPADPASQVSSHRPMDYWGRNLFDHLLRLLPEMLADDGVAYLTQLSILGQQRTAEYLRALGLGCRVVDYAFADLGSVARTQAKQVTRVEQGSDAYHLTFGRQDLVAAYLLEISHHGPGSPDE